MSSELKVGDRLRPLRIGSVSSAAMKRMAVILDDPNQIHLDPEVVKSLGLGERVINQGPTNCGYVIDMLNQNYPTGELRRFTIRFLANVLGEDSVAASGTVSSVSAEPDGVLYGFEVELVVEGRGPALSGHADVFVASP